MPQATRPNAHLSNLLRILKDAGVTEYADGTLTIKFSAAAVAEQAVTRALEKAGLQVEDDAPEDREEVPEVDEDPRAVMQQIHLANARRRGSDA